MERSDIILENLKQCKESTGTENAKRKAVTNKRKKKSCRREKMLLLSHEANNTYLLGLQQFELTEHSELRRQKRWDMIQELNHPITTKSTMCKTNKIPPYSSGLRRPS